MINNDYLITRGEMGSLINAGIFSLKSGQTLDSDNLILGNQEARDKIANLFTPALPVDTTKVPVNQEFGGKVDCGTSKTVQATNEKQDHNYAVNMAIADTGTYSISWPTSAWSSGSGHSGMRFRIFYPYGSSTPLYDQTFTSTNPPPASINWTYNYNNSDVHSTVRVCISGV